MRKDSHAYPVLLMMLAAGLLSLLAGCAAMMPKASIYDLQSGATTEATFQAAISSGGGEMTAEGNGEHFRGRFSAVPDDMTTQEALMKLADGIAWQQGFAPIFGQTGKGQGTATLTGDKGTVLDFLYTYDKATGHGSGSGVDNKGHKYKIMF